MKAKKAKNAMKAKSFDSGDAAVVAYVHAERDIELSVMKYEKHLRAKYEKHMRAKVTNYARQSRAKLEADHGIARTVEGQIETGAEE